MDYKKPPTARIPGLSKDEIEELRQVIINDDHVIIGAAVPYSQMEKGELGESLPALAEAARTVGSPQIRAAGSLGGNLGTCSPAGDSLPVLSATNSIVHLTSVAARAVASGTGIYPASKAGVIALTEQAAVELGPMGIRVNAVGPGRIETEGTAGRTGGNEDSLIGASAIALGRWGRANDIAEAIGFLCSPQSSYITGQVIWVDGGLTIGTNDYLRHMRTSKK